MPGKRKAPTKSVDTKDKKDVEHKTKAAKKSKEEEEDMEEEVNTKTESKRGSRSKSKDTLAVDSKDKKKSPSKSPSKSPAKKSPSKSPAKGKAAAKGKGKGKKEEDEDEEEEDDKKEETKKDTKKAKGGAANSKKLDRNRSNIADTVADDITDPDFELGDGKIAEKEIVISSWNVAGLNSILKKNSLHNYLKDRKPHILCLNETKMTPETLASTGTKWVPEGYTSYFNNCKTKKGYSGTAIITQTKPMGVNFGIGIKKHDLEGRTITLEFEHFYLISCYVPNAGEKLVGLDYRTKEWDTDFSAYLNKLKAKKHVILCGDLNVAHKDIDIYETKGKHKFAGFTPEERKGFGDFLETGFVDTFRHLHPEEQKFSYFSARFPKLKAENRGWRLDYFVIDKEGLSGVKESLINEKIDGSDHLPIELVLKPQFK